MKKFEKILYSFGINLSCYNLNKEITLLKEKVPELCLNRDIIDIGCGDGKTSLLLKEALRPKSFAGEELSPALAKKARKRGITVKNANVEMETPSGDLGILWGVIHHLNDPETTLKKLIKNFNSLIIREPLNRNRFFESGKRYEKQELLDIFPKAGINLKKCLIIKTPKEKSLIIFFDKNYENYN